MGSLQGRGEEARSGPVAVLSDIHGNWRALGAVLADVRRRGVQRLVNLGDCLYGPFDPRLVADTLLELEIPTVSGNEDRVLVEGAAGASVSRTARFTIDRLDRRHLNWVAGLPQIVRVDGFVCFHGTPANDTIYLLTRPQDGRLVARADAVVAQLLGEIREPLILCGHDHTPSVVRLGEERTIVDPGSVGCPAYADDAPEAHVVETGSPHARYAVVTWDDDGPRVELISVSYDADAAANEAARNGFPDWAQWVRTGRVAAR